MALSERDQELYRAFADQGASLDDVNRQLLTQQAQLTAYQSLPADIVNQPGVMDALLSDPEALQLVSNNPEARDAFIESYRQTAGYQGGYDGAAPTGYSGGGGTPPGAAFEAIAQPVMPQTVNDILNQPASFFQELALADGFDPRRFGGQEVAIYA